MHFGVAEDRMAAQAEPGAHDTGEHRFAD